MHNGSKAEVEIPVSDEEAITETTVYISLAAMWDDLTKQRPWFRAYSADTRRVMKFMFYTAASEVLRTVAFRLNSEQSEQVFTDFDKEIRAYDIELQAAAEELAKVQ